MNTPPSQRCFGPFVQTPPKVSWTVSPSVRRCTNPQHGGHFVDTRTGVIMTCGGPFMNGRAPGPSHHKMCQPHGHIVDVNTTIVIG
jgi:hypothetical protein